MVAKIKNFKKNGKEIMDLYDSITKSGITPEDGMLFLLAYMQQTKAGEIGMDIKSDSGETFCLKVSIHNGTINNTSSIIPENSDKYRLSMVR